MAADFRLKDGEKVRTKRVTIATGEVLEAGDLVEMSSGLPIKATASGAKLAWCPAGSASGEVIVELSTGNDFTLLGSADAVFAVNDHAGKTCDLVVNSTNQEIDVGTASTNVLKITFGVDGYTVDSLDDIEVRIAKPIF